MQFQFLRHVEEEIAFLTLALIRTRFETKFSQDDSNLHRSVKDFFSLFLEAKNDKKVLQIKHKTISKKNKNDNVLTIYWREHKLS